MWFTTINYVRTYINRTTNMALVFCEESCSLNFLNS
nr:MAG TPA: hypothetical protein [Bacteriophage sp.]DAZ75732.1 MAG TPA: hypothetical protein [Caudoviricetes sp.]